MNNCTYCLNSGEVVINEQGQALTVRCPVCLGSRFGPQPRMTGMAQVIGEPNEQRAQQYLVDEPKEPMEQQPRPNTSFDYQVASLQVSESISKVRAVDPTMMVQRLPDELPEIRTQIRNACAPAVRRAKDINDTAQYTVEVGDAVMPSGKLYVVAIVTRTA